MRPCRYVFPVACGCLLLASGNAWTNPGRVGAGAAPGSSPDRSCAEDGGAAIQVLGSGGPMHAQGRGSAAYLLWYERRAAVVIDMGGDTAAALARAGVAAGEIDILLLSHLHPDHVSGLPDFLWGEMVAGRHRPLVIAGPSGSGAFLPLEAFLARQFGEQGAFPFMRGVLTGEPFVLETKTVDASAPTAQPLGESGKLRLSALAVPHGRTPALAFRVDGPGFSVVFGGDQTARSPGFLRFAADADVLVVHAMLTERAAGSDLSRVVALPGDLARQAAESRVGHLVLGHLMGAGGNGDEARLWSLASIASVIDGIRASYAGTLTVASDGLCIPLPGGR